MLGGPFVGIYLEWASEVPIAEEGDALVGAPGSALDDVTPRPPRAVSLCLTCT